MSPRDKDNSFYVLINNFYIFDQCRINKGSPIIPILSQINTIVRNDTYFFKIHSNTVLGLTKGFFPVGLSVKSLKEPLSYSILAIWPAHINLLDLITLHILGDQYKLWSSPLWCLHSPFSSLLSPNIRLKILFSNTLSLRSSLAENLSSTGHPTSNISQCNASSPN